MSVVSYLKNTRSLWTSTSPINPMFAFWQREIYISLDKDNSAFRDYRQSVTATLKDKADGCFFYITQCINENL